MQANAFDGEVVKLRAWIARVLWTGGGALGIGMISGLLSLILDVSGDKAGAEAVRGVMLVALIVFVLDLVSLVVLLAVVELRRSENNCPPVGRPGHSPE